MNLLIQPTLNIKKMRNTLLITSDFWPNRGGVANYYYNLVKNLPANNIFILTSTKKEKSSLKIYNKTLLFKLIWPHWLKSIFISIQIIQQEKIKILWVGELLPFGMVAYIIYKLFKIPYFVSLHGLDILNSRKTIIKKILTKKILNNARFITTNSQYTKNLLQNTVSKQSKIKIIYPGVNKNFIELNNKKLEEIKNRYNLKNKKIILTIGRLINRKNHQLVINAMKELVKNDPNLMYLIIGDGPQKNNLEAQIKQYHLEKYIKILTTITNNELPYFYNLANIFVMVSKTNDNDIEGFGIVYLEAGSFAKPVIASTRGGSKEAVLENKTGLLIEDNSIKDLKDAINKLLRNKKLATQLGDNAQTRIKRKFLWKDISKKLIEYIGE